MATNNSINNKVRNKNSKAAEVGQLIAGAKKRFPNGSQEILLEGASTTIDAVTKELQALVENRAAVVAAQATAKTTVETEASAMPALIALASAFTAFVKVSFRNKADALAEFGIKPPKARSPMTAEQKAVAAAKRAATRAARGTKGPKAKKAVHGNITAQLVVTPVTPDTTEAPTKAPATAPVATPSGGGATQQHS
jgi:hypothetical protein